MMFFFPILVFHFIFSLFIFIKLFYKFQNYKIKFIFFKVQQVWTQKCAVQKASVDVNISYY